MIVLHTVVIQYVYSPVCCATILPKYVDSPYSLQIYNVYTHLFTKYSGEILAIFRRRKHRGSHFKVFTDFKFLALHLKGKSFKKQLLNDMCIMFEKLL